MIGAALLFIPFGVERGEAQTGSPVVFFDSPYYWVVSNQFPAQATITVQTSDHPNSTITVFYNTSDGTATAPRDYQPASGQLTFPPGVNSQTFTVTAVKSAFPEGPVTANLTLSQAAGANIALGSATVTMADKAPSGPNVSFVYPSWSYNEYDGTVGVSVVLLGNPSAPVSVNYSTSDGTAKAGKNYAAASGTLTWQPSEAGTAKGFSITILDDGVVDPTLTVNLTLSNPVNAGLGIQSTAVFYIVDGDSPCP
jgi:hypothetical protein